MFEHDSVEFGARVGFRNRCEFFEINATEIFHGCGASTAYNLHKHCPNQVLLRGGSTKLVEPDSKTLAHQLSPQSPFRALRYGRFRVEEKVIGKLVRLAKIHKQYSGLL